MIRLDRASLSVRAGTERRAVLDDASFDFGPGIWHLSAAPAGDARLLVGLIAGHYPLDAGSIRRDGLCSWPLSQAAALGPGLTGLDLIDLVCSLHDLERRVTFDFFRDLIEAPDLLGQRFDRWPQAAQRQFAHTAFLAPEFDAYLLDVSPVLPDGAFYRRWRALFGARIAGKVAIIAAAEHRAARRDFPGHRVRLAAGALRRETETAALPLLAAE